MLHQGPGFLLLIFDRFTLWNVVFSVLDEAPESAHIWISENNQYSWYLTWTDMLGVGFELFLLSGNCRGTFSFDNHMLKACLGFHMYNLSVYYCLPTKLRQGNVVSCVCHSLLKKGSLYRIPSFLYRATVLRSEHPPPPHVQTCPPLHQPRHSNIQTDALSESGRLACDWNAFWLSMHSYWCISSTSFMYWWTTLYVAITSIWRKWNQWTLAQEIKWMLMHVCVCVCTSLLL